MYVYVFVFGMEVHIFKHLVLYLRMEWICIRTQLVLEYLYSLLCIFMNASMFRYIE